MDTPMPQSSLSNSSPPPPIEVVRMREVHRAIAELRRGNPVVLAGVENWLLLAAETVEAAGLSRMAQLGSAQPMLFLGEGRAQGLLHETGSGLGRARAVHLPPELVTPAQLRQLADPTLVQNFPAAPSPIHTPVDGEAAVALAKLTRLLPAVLAARLSAEAISRAAKLELSYVTAAAVLSYPASTASHLVRVAEAVVPLDGAPHSRIVAFRAEDGGAEHLAILVGSPEIDAPDLPPPLARLHSECFTGDLLGSLRCDCGPQLRGAIRRMGEEGRGVLLYLAQEGRGIGLVNKLRAYTLQDRGLDTLDANRALGWSADERNFMIAATMLRALHITRIRLLTNNPDKLAALTACGIEVAGREAHSFAPNGINDDYLATKASRFGHLFDLS
jgi:GTP cyclohydrolase II